MEKKISGFEFYCKWKKKISGFEFFLEGKKYQEEITFAVNRVLMPLVVGVSAGMVIQRVQTIIHGGRSSRGIQLFQLFRSHPATRSHKYFNVGPHHVNERRANQTVFHDEWV